MTDTTCIALLVTSGNGPVECQQAVAHVLNAMRNEAELFAIDFDASGSRTRHGFKSAVVLISGAQRNAFANRWRGTIRWRAKSNLRVQHNRANWFVGVIDLPAPALAPKRLYERDVSVETFRAGGPGGQHQNTTDSAVRVVHKPTGLTAVAREERSQHRNKSLALERLRQLMAAQVAAQEDAQRSTTNQLHHRLERGNAVRCFKGHQFREDGKP
ncbi:MAG: peptide chain release factor H [Pelagimonas sp.]|uniref:peptide chain release factor H n=1 Tax=Pelagimonas sp. TaxID=2073170 RepID=UPI003D6ABCB0